MPKPIRIDRDKEEYFRAEFLCPECGTYLAHYTYGRAWTNNGLPQDYRHNCSKCGELIDWSDVPLPTDKEGGHE